MSLYENASVAVVIPCKNEATQIGKVLGTMPDYVDAMIVVDDGSTDDSASVVRGLAEADPRIQLIVHSESKGVGRAIGVGYASARDQEYSVAAVMAGDGQMDPKDLERVIYPVVSGQADYCKGNRFAYPDGLEKIPMVRKLGNLALSVMTKISSGYWHVSDTQSGYTAISLLALEEIDVEHIYPTYGCPNDILIRLNIVQMRVCEVPVNPLYGVGEQSKMRIWKVLIPVLLLLMRGFLHRMFRKYILIDGHPLVFSYMASGLALLGSVVLCSMAIVKRFTLGHFPPVTLLASGIFLVVGLQFLITSFWMDSDANRHLCVRFAPAELGRFAPHRKKKRAV